jgi:hypothetical protein
LGRGLLFGIPKKIIPPARDADNHRKEALMKPKPLFHRSKIIEREEYEALMSELPTQDIQPQANSIPPDLDERIRKIEYCMMIIVGLILVVLLICKGN